VGTPVVSCETVRVHPHWVWLMPHGVRAVLPFEAIAKCQEQTVTPGLSGVATSKQTIGGPSNHAIHLGKPLPSSLGNLRLASSMLRRYRRIVAIVELGRTMLTYRCIQRLGTLSQLRIAPGLASIHNPMQARPIGLASSKQPSRAP
jgi:hypothetical protein